MKVNHMPRKARILLPHTPHHIVQRGHNRQAVFVELADYQYYLDNLKEFKQALGVKVYSFCLMTNHVHLIVECADDVSAISHLLKRLAGRQTRYVNRQEGRSGTLWEGRFKASPIERDAYLLQCYRYVERNPVTAGMVQNPADYPWSSYRHRIDEDHLHWLDDFPHLTNFGEDRASQIRRYRDFVEPENDRMHAFIQSAVQKNQLTGTPRFIDEVEKRIGIRIEQRDQGRPVRGK